jgi:hypothetical protein
MKTFPGADIDSCSRSANKVKAIKITGERKLKWNLEK